MRLPLHERLGVEGEANFELRFSLLHEHSFQNRHKLCLFLKLLLHQFAVKMVPVPLVPILERVLSKSPRDNRIPIMMSHEELASIDEWRFSNRVATRSDAIRRLCQIGMGADEVIVPRALAHLGNLLERIDMEAEDQIEILADLDDPEKEHLSAKEALWLSINSLMEFLDLALILELNLREQRFWMDQMKSPSHATLSSKMHSASSTIDKARNEIRERLREKGYDVDPPKGDK